MNCDVCEWLHRHSKVESVIILSGEEGQASSRPSVTSVGWWPNSEITHWAASCGGSGARSRLQLHLNWSGCLLDSSRLPPVEVFPGASAWDATQNTLVFINPIWPGNDPGPLEELKDADEEKDVWACCSQNLHRREQQKTDGWRILWTQSQILVQLSSGSSPHHHSRLHPSLRNQLLILWSELLTFMWNDPKTPETRTQSCCWMWSPDVVLSSVGSL